MNTNADAPQLTTAILEGFRAALTTAGAPLGRGIVPGLSDDQIDGVEVELGVAVPPELRILWKWGFPSSAVEHVEAGWDINPEFELWSPALAVRATNRYREYEPELSQYIAFAGPPHGGCLLVRGDKATSTSAVFEWYVEEQTRSNEGRPSLRASARSFNSGPSSSAGATTASVKAAGPRQALQDRQRGQWSVGRR